MSELNKMFPEILIGYVNGTGVYFTPEKCNELSKFVSSIETTEPKPTYMNMNNEPLSAKQLHELIVSQSMTIDMLLTEIGCYRSVLAEIVELLSKSRRFTAWYKAKTALV